MDYPNGIEISGNKGKQICLSFIPLETGLNLVKSVLAGGGACSGTFAIGSTSKDYEEGREGGFGDYHGYRKVGDKYYAIFVGGTESELDSSDVTEITTANGIKALVITGRDSVQTVERGMEPKPGNPGEGYMGALINKDISPYIGFNVQMKLSNQLTKELFTQILSTFKFVDQTVSLDTQSDKKIGYIKSIKPNYDSYLINVDYINWVEDSKQPNGYRIDNQSTETVSLPTDLNIPTNSSIIMQTYSYAPDGNFAFNQSINFGQLLEAFETKPDIWTKIPFLIETRGGTIIKITEQYQP
jgi:hypothetical protein